MKKEVSAILLITILLVVLLLIRVIQAQNNTITGEVITGDLASAVSINITVAATPTLTINKPKNQTYTSNHSMELQFDVSDQNSTWYNLDQVENITITGNIKFNTTNGSHTLYLYANNTNGITTKSVTFFVNSGILKCDFNKFDGSYKGNSTNFNAYDYKELQNLSNVTVEHAEYGKIFFNEYINVTDDNDFSDGIVNISQYINVSSNRIYINSTALGNFNKSATLRIYSLTFTNPRILRDGSACPSTICTKQSYSGGTFVFNVTGFSVYSLEETPAEPSGSSGSSSGGGGGGGSGVTTTVTQAVKRFSINTDEIKVNLKQGQTLVKNIIITNNGNQKLELEIQNPKLQDFLKISDETFSLIPGESKLVVIDILVREDILPNLYIGKLVIKGDDIEKEILVAIEVESKKPLFDVKAEIPKKFLYVMPGEELFVKIELFNLGQTERVDASIDYKIIDVKGNEILNEMETAAIETSLKLVKEFKIPDDAKFGKYALYVKATYNGQIGSTSVWFNLGKRPTIPMEKGVIALIIIAIISSIIIAYWLRKLKKYKKHF